MNRSLFILLSCAASALAFVLWCPAEFGYSIRVPGKVMLAREWNLARTSDGGLVTTLYDHVEGAIQSSAVTQFERGDAIDFRLHSAITPGAVIGAGDTVGVITSNSLEFLLSQLRGQLATARASLALNRSGEKEAVVAEARNRITLARQQAEEQRKVADRQRKLSEKGYLALQDLEMAEHTLKLYEINITIAESQLQAALTGAKPEQVQVIRTEIQGLEEEIATLEKRSERLIIRSPFRGEVFRLASGDTLVTLGDGSGYLVSMPVKLRDAGRLSPNGDITVRTPGGGTEFRGKILRLEPVAGVLQGKQVIAAVALVHPDRKGLLPGLIVSCTVPCEPVSAREYAASVLRALFVP